MHLNKKNLFIDLDGTILDTYEGIYNSFVYAFDKMGMEMPVDNVKKFIGPPLVDSMEQFFDKKEDVDRIIAFYREYYVDKGLYECKPFDNMGEVLKELKSRGYKLYVATSKPFKVSLQILKDFGLFDLFDSIYGAMDDTKRGSKDKVIAYALEDSKVDKSETLMIGDTLFDRLGAKDNEMDFASVLYGFGEESDIVRETNLFNAETVKDILNYLPKIQ